MTKFKALLAASTMGFMLMGQAQAAIEIDESDFGPTYESMAVDTVIGKPLQLAAAVGGSIAYAVSYPFAHFGGNIEQSKKTLVDEPWQAMERCLGCTVAEDSYYKARNFNENAIRLVVNGPSEILIDTQDNLVINDYAGTVSQE